jgi:phospholipid transport system substrate-binding protein
MTGFPRLRSIAKVALILSVAALPLTAQVARAASAPEATVSGLYDTLLATMKNGGALGEQGRYAKLDPAIHQNFAIEQMTKAAIGPAAWTNLSPAQQQQAVEAFGRYITAQYADRFTGYSGEQFKVTGAQTSPYGQIVQSQIVKSNGDPVAINYLMVQSGDNWRIADVYLSGTISQVATLRSEFASTLRSQGIGGLIDALNHKADILVASNNRAS